MIPVPRFPSPASARNSVVPWKPPPRRCDWRVLVKRGSIAAAEPSAPRLNANRRVAR